MYLNYVQCSELHIVSLFNSIYTLMAHETMALIVGEVLRIMEKY